MTEERITTEGETTPTNHTTIIHERRSSGGTGMIMAVVLIIAVIGGIYLFSQSNQSEAAKDNAIAGAASDIGDAANKVGNAAEDAVDTATTPSE